MRRNWGKKCVIMVVSGASEFSNCFETMTRFQFRIPLLKIMAFDVIVRSQSTFQSDDFIRHHLLFFRDFLQREFTECRNDVPVVSD